MRLLLISILAIAILTPSCREVFGKKVKGDGNVSAETRTASNFNSISVSDAVDVYVSQDSTYSVRIETDKNLMEYVEISEEGGVLDIGIKKGVNTKPSKGINVFVSAPEFRKLSASGACDIVSTTRLTSTGSLSVKVTGAGEAVLDVSVPTVNVDLTGASKLRMKGETKELDVDGTGSSDIECFDLMAENVSVSITGAGDASVFASVNLDVRVTGSGSVKYKGSPSVNQKISGAGSVRKVE
jgi:hypothetical protein